VKGRAGLCRMKYERERQRDGVDGKEPEDRGMKTGREGGSYSDVKSGEPPRLCDHSRRGSPPKPKAEFWATTLQEECREGWSSQPTARVRWRSGKLFFRWTIELR
jgi:hypothetical protein